MLRVTVLGSGSRGNAIVVDGTEGTLLVDAGFSARTIARRLQAAGREPEQLSAVLLTHEHTDHASGVSAVCARWTLPLHATRGTLEALAEQPNPAPTVTAVLPIGVQVAIDGFEVCAIAVPHDARECAALLITDRRSGARLGIALDLGHVPDTLPSAFKHLDLLVVESNHDEQLLADGPYPWPLKQRIGGPLGHLSNRATAAFVADCAHRGLRGVLLAHLSETNNSPAQALDCTRAALRRSGWRKDVVWAAQQTIPSVPIDLYGVTHASAPSQLSLGF